jgi:hypothetical protein
MNNNSSVKQYVPSTNYPLRFDRLHPGSFFRIFAEPSRGIRKSEDKRVYRKAHDHEGFYAFHTTSTLAIVLMPGDLVQPLKLESIPSS